MPNRGTYQFNSIFYDVLWVDHGGQGLDTVLRPVQDGAGNNSMLSIATNKFNIDTTTGGVFTIDGVPFTQLPTASYITATANAGYTNERILTAGNNITVADGGAGGNFVVNLQDNPVMTGNAGFTLPVGTTAQRPLVPNAFEMRANSDLTDIEAYVGGVWINILTGASGVTSVSGTLNRITSTGGNTPVIDISAAYVGQASITTLGTIATGTWSATNIALNKGGTNAALIASNGAIAYSTTTALALSAQPTVNDQILLGTVAGAPTWSTATYPAATTINQILYSAALNTIAGLATANNGVLVTSAGGVPSIGASLPAAVQGNITTVGTIGTGVWNGSNIPLGFGGTNAALVASTGGIFYSTASAGAILAGTATANQVLLSGSTAAPAWSAATYPSATTINQLLYSSSANVIGGLATANNGMLVTSNAGVPSISALGAGQVFIGTTGAAPTAAALTQGSGVTITSASGSITIASSFVGNWVDQTATTVTMAVNTNYVADNVGLVTLTLPAVAALGSTFSIVGKGAGGWKLAQAIGQQINFGTSTTTSGVGGSLASTNTNDCVSVVCVTANTNFVVVSSVGNLTVV